jgi:hypothetical protein
MASNIVRIDQIRGIQGPDITSSYRGLGFDYTATHPPTQAPFTHMMRVLHFINDTNGVLMISFDGVTDNAIVLPNSFVLYDLTSDQDDNESFRYQAGTELFVKYLVAPTPQTVSTNTLYLVAVYGKGE